MKLNRKVSGRTLMVAGVSLMAMVAASASYGFAARHDDDEKSKKRERTVIELTTSNGDMVIERKDGKVFINGEEVTSDDGRVIELDSDGGTLVINGKEISLNGKIIVGGKGHAFFGDGNRVMLHGTKIEELECLHEMKTDGDAEDDEATVELSDDEDGKDGCKFVYSFNFSDDEHMSGDHKRFNFRFGGKDGDHKREWFSNKRGGHTFSFNSDEAGSANKDAIAEVEKSLASVENRLKKAKKKSEKKALRAAKAGLETALKAMKSSTGHGNMMFFGGGDLAFGHGGDARLYEFKNRHGVRGKVRGELKELLEGLKGEQDDIREMRIEILDDVSGLREVIIDSMGDIDIDLESGDHDVRVLRFGDLKGLHRRLEGMEEEQLKALKRAEERLKRRREELEKRLEEKKSRDSKDK